MQLNLLGWRTGTGNHWTRMRVRELRSRLDLPACDPKQPTWLTAKGAAKHLGISPAYAGLLLKRGIIPGTQAVPGSIWWVDPTVLDSPQLRKTLRALSERRLVNRHHDDRTLRISGISGGTVSVRTRGRRRRRDQIGEEPFLGGQSWSFKAEN